MHTVEILEKARELISDESRWTQGAYAKDEIGASTHPWDDDAVCFCALGAIKKAGGFYNDVNPASMLLGRLLAADDAAPDRGIFSVDEFNDGSTHAEVLSLFDRAIAAARAA